MKHLLRNGRVLDPASGVDETLDLLIEDGKVARLGRRLAVRGAQAFGRKDPVRVHLEWDDGAVNTLPGLVRTCAPMGAGLHLAHVDVEAVEGDWDAFLRYLGTRIASAAVA